MCLGAERFGKAVKVCQGMLRTGKVRKGLEGSHGSAGLVMDSHGAAVEVRRGKVRNGMERCGGARQSRRGLTRWVTLRNGEAVVASRG